MTWFLDKEFLESLDPKAYDPAILAQHTGVDIEVARQFVDPARRYWVNSSEYGWLAGANGEGKPTLVFVGAPRLASAVEHPINAISFDLPTGAITTTAIPVEGELDWGVALDAAAEAIGFEHVGNCPVLAFKYPGIWHYAVVPFPYHLHDDAMGKDAGSRDELRAWIESGGYVLHSGNAFFMSADGDVEST